MIRIETARTTMRPFEEADVEAAFGWFGNPEVMRYTRGPDPSLSETRRRIAAYSEQQARLGFSKWIVLDRATGERIGDAGLLVLAEVGPLPDLGYRLIPSRWGLGLASEIAAAWVSAAFRELELKGVSAFAAVEHSRSHRVLLKIGFRRVGQRVVMGSDAAVFELLRRDFTRSEAAPT